MVARSDFFAALIPFYALLLLLMKKDSLSVFEEAKGLYRLVGLVLMIASFFVYYGVAVFYPDPQFFGAANYTIYLIGLFLFFFQRSALRESFSALFLIVAAVPSGFAGKWLEFYLDPLVPHFVKMMGFILWILGIPAKSSQSNSFILQMPDGNSLAIGVVAGCIGIYSFLTFAIIIVVTMIEDRSALQTRLLWSVAGIVGTFFVNIVRVSLIFAVIYYFGYEDWSKIHTPIGYVLFIAWLALFFFVFSERQAITRKLRSCWRRLR